VKTTKAVSRAPFEVFTNQREKMKGNILVLLFIAIQWTHYAHAVATIDPSDPCVPPYDGLSGVLDVSRADTDQFCWRILPWEGCPDSIGFANHFLNSVISKIKASLSSINFKYFKTTFICSLFSF